MTSDVKVSPDLTGRKAKCDICPEMQQSSRSLDFYRYRPENEFDSYYCGCKGWN